MLEFCQKLLNSTKNENNQKLVTLRNTVYGSFDGIFARKNHRNNH